MRYVSALIMVAIALAGCGGRSKRSALLPETGQASGWARSAEIRTFEASKLWEYIDGDAEKYTRFGVERALTADYRYRDRIDAVAEIYIMGNADGARKVFDSEPDTNSLAIGLGDAARLYGASLIFRKDRYLVRLVAYREAPEVANALTDLGRAIETNITAQGTE